MPMAIAAPILMQVPAIGPYIIAPEIVPNNEPFIPILEEGLKIIENV